MRATTSPRWYRRRGLLIGLLYFIAFGSSYERLSGQTPSAIVWGLRLGPSGPTLLLWVAAALALAAYIVRAWGTAYLHWTIVQAPDAHVDRLIVAGPFRYVRNPLYDGNLLLALGMGLVATPLGFAILMVGNVAVVVLLAGEERRRLAARFKATYDAYRRLVPAFVPRLTPADVPGTATVPPEWRQAFFGEAFCGLLALGIAFLALFGRGGLTAWTTCWITAVSLLIVQRVTADAPATRDTKR